MENSKKKDQNKSYYLRNKQKLLEKARLRAQEKAPEVQREEGSVVSLFKKSEIGSVRPKRNKKSDFQRSGQSWGGEAIFLMGLVVLMTAFLFHETATFFFLSGAHWGSACMKALILEGAAIAFAVMQGRNLAGSVFNKIMVLLIYSFGVWVVSYPIVSSTQTQQNQAELHQKVIRELETEISKKEVIRDQYWKQDRVTFARRYDQSLDLLKVHLDSARKESAPAAENNLVYGLLFAGIFFRVLTMVSNFLCIRYLRNRYSS